MKVFAQWYDYPIGSGPYGSGGWSRNAKRKPARVLRSVIGFARYEGKKMVVGGVRRLKLNAWDLSDGRQLRRDYPDAPPAPHWMGEPLLRAAKAAEVSETVALDQQESLL